VAGLLLDAASDSSFKGRAKHARGPSLIPFMKALSEKLYRGAAFPSCQALPPI